MRANLSDAITEVHIVGGHNPDYPYEFYLDLVPGIHELKAERDRLVAEHDHSQLHAVRRELHTLKHAIRKIEAKAAHA